MLLIWASEGSVWKKNFTGMYKNGHLSSVKVIAANQTQQFLGEYFAIGMFILVKLQFWEQSILNLSFN